MTPTPSPSPSPKKSTAKITTPKPAPTVTVTQTEVSVVSTPPDDSVWDVAQGVGSILAVVVALVALVITIVNAGRDRDEAGRQLDKERDKADARLQKQLDDQREHERRRFLVGRLEHVGELYGRSIATDSTAENAIAIQGMLLALRAIPDPYASLCKLKMNTPLTHAGKEAAKRRMEALGIHDVPSILNGMIFDELAENITDLFAGSEHVEIEDEQERDRGE